MPYGHSHLLSIVIIAQMGGLGYTLFAHCDIIPMLSHPIRQRKGGVHMDSILSFLVSVMAGIVSYYICKWLDGNDSDN